MDIVLAAFLGALATALVGPLMVASAEVRRHDRQIAERDEDLEEWIVVRHRRLKQRWNEIDHQANAQGVLESGAPAAGRQATRTLLLYDYRDEMRAAHNFVLRIGVEERWTHRLMRRLLRRRFPRLTTPDRAKRLVDYWNEGTGRNALTWSLTDILEEIGPRVPSRALHDA